MTHTPTPDESTPDPDPFVIFMIRDHGDADPEVADTASDYYIASFAINVHRKLVNVDDPPGNKIGIHQATRVVRQIVAAFDRLLDHYLADVEAGRCPPELAPYFEGICFHLEPGEFVGITVEGGAYDGGH